MSYLRSSALVITNIVTGIVASIGLLSCDFIDDNKVTAPITIDFPSFQQIYSPGDKNQYTFNDGSGGLILEWDTSFPALIDPFTNLPTNLNLVRFSATVTSGSLSAVAKQYITQSSAAADDGSMFLHAIDTGLPATDYWIEGNLPLTSLGSVQTIYSPYQIDAASAGEKGVRHTNKYQVMGNCTQIACQAIADVTEVFTVADEPLVVITTTLGEFETYKISYDITVIPNQLTPPTSVLDYRTACGAIDFSQIVSASGTLFVHPDIGPIRIENNCFFPGAFPGIYGAELTSTTFPVN